MVHALRVASGSALVLAAPDLYTHFARSTRPEGLAIGLAAASIVAGVVLLSASLRALLPPGTLCARRGLPAGLAARALLAWSFFGTEAFVPLGAGELRGSSPTAAGLALTAASLGWISASWGQDRLDTRNGPEGRHRRVGVGFVLVSLGIALVSAGLLTTWPVLLIPLGWGVAGTGMGLAYSAGGLVCIAAAPAGREGEVSGQLQLAEALSTAAGTGLGGALLTAIVRSGHSPHRAHTVVFGVTFTLALVGIAISRRLGPASGDAGATTAPPID